MQLIFGAIFNLLVIREGASLHITLNFCDCAMSSAFLTHREPTPILSSFRVIAILGDAWALLEREEKYDVIAAKFTYIAIFPRLCHRHPNHLIK